MKRTLKSMWDCIAKASYYTIMHDGVEHAGYLAFLGLLSIFPFLVFFVAIAGLVGEAEVGKEFVGFVVSNLPEHIIAALKPRMVEIVEGPPQGLLTLAIVGVIWTASSAVEGTRTILNRAYRVETPPAYIWRRLLSIAQFLAMTAVLLIATMLMVALPVFLAKVETLIGVEHVFNPFWSYMGYAISAFTVFAVIAISYYILPNIKQRLRTVLPGAFMVMVLWIAALYAFSMFLQEYKQVNLVYGSLAGIIISLLFFYLLAVIYIFGAEFNYFLEVTIGHRFEPREKTATPKRRESDKSDPLKS